MSRWIGVITNSGKDLMNKWVQEGTLVITGAGSGDETVPQAALMAQKTITGTKRKASIVGYRKITGGTQIRIQITKSNEQYELHQFGVWATLRNGEGNVEGQPILMALFQTEHSIQIPCKEDSPDFVYTFYGAVCMDNTGKFEVIIDTAAIVSMETLTDEIDRLKLEIMTNTLTLPLAAASGEPLLTSTGSPILAVHHPRELGGNYEY